MPSDAEVQLIMTAKDNLSNVLKGMGNGIQGLGREMDGVAATAQKSGGIIQSAFSTAMGVFTGGALLGAIGSVKNAVMGLAGEAFNAYAENERLGMSLESLIAKQIKNASATEVVTGSMQVVSHMTAKETKEFDALNEKLNKLYFSLPVAQEAFDKLAKSGKASASVLAQKRNVLEGMREEYDQVNARLIALGASEGAVSTVTQKSTVYTKNMTQALEEAKSQAKDLQEWIQQLAITSPFEQKEVAQAVKQGMAFGFTTKEAQRITTAMIDFTSATGASGEVMAQVTRVIGQMKGAGRVLGGDLLQLTGAGIGVNEILKKMGTNMADVAKSGASSEQFIEALLKTMEEDFGGAAKRQAASMSGLKSTITDLKTVGPREFFSGTFQAMQPFLAGALDKIATPQTFAKINAIGQVIGTKLSGALTSASNLLQKVTPQIEAFATKLASGAVKAKDDVVGLFNVVSPAVRTLGDLLAGKGGNWGVLFDLIKAFGADASQASNWAGILYRIAGGIGELVKGNAPAMWAGLGVPKIILDDIASVQGIFDNLQGIAGTLLKGLKGQNIWEDMVTFDPQAGGAMVTPGLKSQLSAMSMQMGQALTEHLINLETLVTDTAAKISLWANNPATQAAVLQASKDIGYGLMRGLSGLVGSAEGSAELQSGLALAAEQAGAGIVAIGTSIGKGLANGIGAGITQFFTPEKLAQLFKWESMTPKSGGLLGKALEGMNKAVNPSQYVTQSAAGVPLPEGYANGFNGLVTAPRLFMAGEAGPERVTVTPLAQGTSSGNTNTVTFYITTPDPRLAGDSILAKLRSVGMA